MEVYLLSPYMPSWRVEKKIYLLNSNTFLHRYKNIQVLQITSRQKRLFRINDGKCFVFEERRSGYLVLILLIVTRTAVVNGQLTRTCGNNKMLVKIA